MKPQIVAMSFGAAAFTCPFCLVNSQQGWHQAMDTSKGHPHQLVEELVTGLCLNCKYRTVWFKNEIIYPKVISTAPGPVEYMPEDIRKDFNEAREVLFISPRSACALLRLCIEKICLDKGSAGKTLNANIKDMVLDGLSSQAQKGLDIVRIMGNNALHPKDVIGGDSDETARYMFEVVNLVVDDLYAREKRLEVAYANLPQSIHTQIESRDKQLGSTCGD